MRKSLWLALLCIPAAADAATVQSFSPQNTTRDVRQVTARFSEPMVAFGDPRLPDPFQVSCPAAGHGRWVDERNWAYDFDADLPAGLACRFSLPAALKTLGGNAITGKREFAFDTGGPAIRVSMPSPDSGNVDAAQVFILGLDAPATKASIEAHAYCAVANLAEKLPLQVLEGSERDQVLAQRRELGYSYYRVLRKNGDEDFAQVKHDELSRRENALVVARCARPLPESTAFDLVWDAGVATASGLATRQAQVLSFGTRAAFNATFSCDRINAGAPCVPVLPMQLRLSAPVPARLAAQVRIVGGGQTFKPDKPGEDTPFVDSLDFRPPFPESATLELHLPEGFVDDAGRKLANAGSFPLKIGTDNAPPLAKFSGEFGILEAAEGGVLPVTLRDVEDSLPALKIGGAARRIDDEAQVLRWSDRVKTGMRGRWDGEAYVQPGTASVFAGESAGGESFALTRPQGGRSLEVIGIPLKEPGFYVVELASPRLGAALLDKAQPRYVATTALVTNMAVHFQWGREGSLVFVTTLDGGKPVDGAQVRIGDGCDGRALWAGSTDGSGIARLQATLPEPSSWSSCDSPDAHPLMVSARKGGDFSFVMSDWSDGISPNDFNLPMGRWDSPDIAHAVLDRSLFRAGETVSMKHYWRRHGSQGLSVPDARPDQLVISHTGSDQHFELPLSFDAAGIAETTWEIPKEAKLGEYALSYRGNDQSTQAGSFRVEQYRVPLMRALIEAPKEPAIAAREVPLNLFVGYFSGGGTASLPVKLRTQVQPRSLSFPQYEGFSFEGSEIKEGLTDNGGSGYFADEDDAARAVPSQVSRTLPLTLDANGSAHSTVGELPVSASAQTLVTELEYPDANGEMASVRSSVPLWPSAVVLGIAPGSRWGGSGPLKFQALALDVKGQPLAKQAVKVALYQRKTHSYRKRLVGGFYAYSHSTETRRLSDSCSGRTDEHGLLICAVDTDASGEIVMEATASDDRGRVSRAVAETWRAGKDESWFAQNDSDRMDVLADAREVAPGDTLKLQVRMPFRKATALVTVEREGVLDAFVTELSGKNPVVNVPMLDRYAPNVYVSVLALRPRVSDFRSRFVGFLRWLGLDRWLKLDGGPATALVDLSKPAYRLGITPVDVGWNAHRLNVTVKPQQATYATRGVAKVDVQVQPQNGAALPASAEIAFSAVDEALLDLLPNPSVNLLDAMMQRRGIEVFTSTAQMQVVGKRHYGRKSLPPGGGGGRGAPREMLDSLLLWKGRVPLDAQGHASVDVPLNDALTSFRLTAVASAGADRFGEGHASIRTTQDIQLLSGLPPLVREGDRYDAQFTVRNTSAQAQSLSVSVQLQGDGRDLPAPPAQTLTVPANTAVPAHFDITAPLGVTRLQWLVSAHEAGATPGKTLDALKTAQDVATAYPVRVYQATLMQLQGSQTLPVEAPKDAIADAGIARGGVRVALSPSLTTSLDSVRDYMSFYAYTCVEQLASRAIALGDHAGWDTQMARLSTVLDRDGLARYFPSEWLEGSDVLTSYLLQISAESGWEIPETERERMLDGLSAFAQGKLQRAIRVNGVGVTERRLAAIEALSRFDRAQSGWLTSLNIDPTLLHTSALIDWIGILQRLKDVPQREDKLADAKNSLRSRFNFQGTTMGFSTEQDDALWWLMISADVNANRAILALLGEADWQDDMARLVRGAVGRQQRGHWNLTTANAWGTLALQGFAAKFEKTPVSGATTAALAQNRQRHEWNNAQPATLDLPWPAGPGTLALAHEGAGAPWVTVQSRAAIPLREPFSSGYRITRRVTPVEQKTAGRWTRGDVARVSLEIDAQSDMSWVVIDDPVPGGSTLLGSGLGRDSAMLAQGERKDGDAWPAYEERRFDAYRAYYAFVPKGRFSTEYTVRYNNAGMFQLPATRVEAMYAPEMLGESPNAPVEVLAP